VEADGAMASTSQDLMKTGSFSGGVLHGVMHEDLEVQPMLFVISTLLVVSL
jgi:hypothetical protein